MKNEIIVSILNDEYKVIVCWGTPEEIKKVLKKWCYPMEEIKSTHFESRGVCFHNEECHPVIGMLSFPKTPDEIGTIAHEAVHAVEDIFDKIGEKTGEEIYAHCVGAIVRKVLSTNG